MSDRDAELRCIVCDRYVIATPCYDCDLDCYEQIDCPEDDTCECEVAAKVNAALASTAGRDELKRRQRAEARVASLSADAAACAAAMQAQRQRAEARVKELEAMIPSQTDLARLKAKIEAADALVLALEGIAGREHGIVLALLEAAAWSALKAYEELP